MKLLPASLLLGLGALVARGEPVVIGYERFHAAAPGAAGGRLLYNEAGCGHCHGGDTGLPERRGPDLTVVTSRYRPDWIRAYLAEPDDLRSGAVMPHLFVGENPEDINAVLHYLGTLAPKRPAKAKLLRHINAVQGRVLYHTVGCVACHAPRADYPPPEGGSISAAAVGAVALPDLSAKYVLASLAEFLRDPQKTRPDGRMPRIALEDQEAADIAAYLLGLDGSDGEAAPKLAPFKPEPNLAVRGRELITALRCAACHTLPATAAVATVPLRRTTGGCLAEDPAPGVPRFELAPGQGQALQAYLAVRDQPLAPAERVTLTLEALNCTACHERAGRGGPEAVRRPYFAGDPNLGDTGRYPPPLTGVGHKLQRSWLERALQGAVQVRPYLQTRMPVYGGAVESLPALLAEVDEPAPVPPLPPGDVAAGRKLLGIQGGVNCITCHRWKERASLGIQGMDLSNLAERLQPGWLRAYLINPAAHRPGTLMPSFWPEGKAANPAILGGDTDRQIASILAFAREGRGLPEGFPATASREFELTPGPRPIVLRTFMEGVGTHAILVGFPAGVHLAYDGREGRPALAWRGRFFDAYGTWFSRFAPFENPLGEAVVRWAAADEPAAARRFEGYRLDAAGVPTFLYSVDGVGVEERFEAVAPGLRRTVRWNVEALRSLPLTHPAGVTVTEAPESGAGQRSFLYTW